ncbi:acetate kinase [Nitrobacteraceae bacterium AZCC 1564]
MAKAILTLNAGSSSLKFSLFEMQGADRLALVSKGIVDGVGLTPRFEVFDTSGKRLEQRAWTDRSPDFSELLSVVIEWSEAQLGSNTLAAVGHRVVHGGPDHDRPELVTPQLLKLLADLTPLAPLHEPHNLSPIHVLERLRPQLPQVACFDTAFHHSMPVVAKRLALPRAYEAEGVRRYGFHGLSYEYIAEQLQVISPALAKGRVIAAHLGNGASLCALRSGRSIETTMGFTALEGLMMGTRCGSLDPGVILYLEEERGMTPKQVSELLYTKSGLLGVSGGISSDMRDLLASSDSRAREAVELFAYRIVKEVGALTSVLSGLDGVVFTAGIGEHAPQVRDMVCAQLGWLGIVIDKDANEGNADKISSAGSKVEVHVIPTNEEMMIARHTLATISRALG